MMMRLNRNIIRKGSKIDRHLEQQYGSKLFTYQQIFGMLLPIVLDNLFITLISLLTTAMISSSSQESVSAVSMVNPLAMMMWAIISAISVGGTVIVAQYKGSGNSGKIRDAAGQVILATFLISVLGCVILVVFADPLINWMFGVADPVVKAKARGYLIGLAISQIFLAIYTGAFGIFRGIGETKICLKLTIVINLIHLCASVLFLNVMKLDIIGTSLSLIIARLIGSVMAIWLLMNSKSVLRLYPKNILLINKRVFKSVFNLGIPYALEQIFFNGGSMIVQTYLVQLGTISIAANAIANSSFSMLYTVGGSVGVLATTIVGQSFGAQEMDLTKRYGAKMTRLGTVVSVLSILVLYPCMPIILKLYQAPEETLSVIYQLLLITIIPMPFFWSCSNIMPGVLRATGDMTFVSLVSLTTMWMIRVGLGYVFAITLGFGISGAWICMGIEWAVRSVIFYLRYRSDVWLKKKAIE